MKIELHLDLPVIAADMEAMFQLAVRGVCAVVVLPMAFRPKVEQLQSLNVCKGLKEALYFGTRIRAFLGL